MRVISQDGTIDIPYELSAVTIGHKVDLSKFNINIRSKLLDERPCIVATYSTEEKAIKAMEMLREAYVGMPIVMQNVDISEDVAKEFERLKECGIMVRAENQPSKVDFINNAVFRFPQDEDVEISNGLE